MFHRLEINALFIPPVATGMPVFMRLLGGTKGAARMFYGHEYSGWYTVLIWIGVTLVFGISLHLAFKANKIELERSKELYIVVISAITIF